MEFLHPVFLYLRRMSQQEMVLENAIILDETWLWYCFNVDSFFLNQWTEEPKREVQIIWLDFPQANPAYLQALTG